MIVATIDIGTNSVLLLVAEQAGRGLEPLLERATITRLGAGVDQHRRLSQEACERTLSCLAVYAAELKAAGAERLDAVGTSALRDAANGAEFLNRAEQILGSRPRVIGGLEEASLTFNGALSGLAVAGRVSVFDIGGGSTEIIVGAARDSALRAGEAVSLDIGSVRLFERHVHSDPALPDELERARLDIRAALAGAPTGARETTLVGVAGTVTQLAALDLKLASYDARRVHGYELSQARVHELAAELASSSLAARRKLPGMHAQRADVIVIGSLIASEVVAWANAETLVVSDRGVRWGLAEALLKPTAP